MEKDSIFMTFMSEHLFTKQASESDDKIMSSPKFKENFAENYNEIIENEEESHKEELNQEGFYEKAVEEATNKAIEETKSEVFPIATQVEDILNGCDKCAKEIINELYKEAAPIPVGNIVKGGLSIGKGLFNSAKTGLKNVVKTSTSVGPKQTMKGAFSATDGAMNALNSAKNGATNAVNSAKNYAKEHPVRTGVGIAAGAGGAAGAAAGAGAAAKAFNRKSTQNDPYKIANEVCDILGLEKTAANALGKIVKAKNLAKQNEIAGLTSKIKSAEKNIEILRREAGNNPTAAAKIREYQAQIGQSKNAINDVNRKFDEEISKYTNASGLVDKKGRGISNEEYIARLNGNKTKGKYTNVNAASSAVEDGARSRELHNVLYDGKTAPNYVKEERVLDNGKTKSFNKKVSDRNVSRLEGRKTWTPEGASPGNTTVNKNVAPAKGPAENGIKNGGVFKNKLNNFGTGAAVGGIAGGAAIFGATKLNKTKNNQENGF